MRRWTHIHIGSRRVAKDLANGCGRWTLLFSQVLALVVFLPLRSAMGGVSAQPSREVAVHAGDDISRLVEQHPPGTEFRIQAGTYRLQSITPKDGDSFIGEPVAILNGAQLLAGFSRSGHLWVVAAQATQRSANRGTCTPAHPSCSNPEDLFIDNVPLLRVANQDEVGPGKWYLDYATQKAYFADEPAGHTVEMSLRPYAIKGGAANVRIEGLTFEKYACEAGDGAVDGRADSGQLSRNWAVQNNVVRLNHGMGIRMGDGMQVVGNKILQNGQMGVGGGGSNGLVDALTRGCGGRRINDAMTQ